MTSSDERSSSSPTGRCFAAARSARAHGRGEVVFNTAITGYRDLTIRRTAAARHPDHPHIGNTGVNDEDTESARIYAEALIRAGRAGRHSSWRARSDLPSYSPSTTFRGSPTSTRASSRASCVKRARRTAA